jgi:hypothetical protein
MYSKELKYLPTDILQIIYKMYYPWVLNELLEKYPEKNSLVVRTLQSNAATTEINIPLGYLTLDESRVSNIYRSGISSQPSEILKYWWFVNLF